MFKNKEVESNHPNKEQKHSQVNIIFKNSGQVKKLEQIVTMEI